ncbi:MAG TPA: pilus assembly protein PilM [Syntrophales bacterium]|nr:pilus assembly protein PilM [Syntrophales bacterium]
MARLKEITSTERLLDIIRNKRDEVEKAPLDTSKIDPPRKIIKFLPAKITKIGAGDKPITIGVDIGHEYLRIVMTQRLADKRWELLDFKSVPYPQGMTRRSPGFSDFLRDELNKFCGGNLRNANLWAIMSAARVNVRHINIPKVAKKQIENAVYWTIKKETPFDDKDTVFDYEIQREVTEQGVGKWQTMVYTAPKEEIEDIRTLFSGIGLPLTGISITPFAIQNLFKAEWIPPAVEGTVASLFIGNDFSRIDIFSRGKLIMTRGIKAGINSMVEALMERLSTVRKGVSEPERSLPPISFEQAKKALFSLSPDSPRLVESDVGSALSDEEKFATILPALERVIRQVERTFEHYSSGHNYDVVTRIFVSSAMNISQPLVDYVGNQLGIKSDILNPIKYKMPNVGRGIEQTSVSEILALIPAFGLALSDNAYTPNLIFRFKDKEREANIGRANRVIFAAFLVGLIVCGFFLLFEIQKAGEKEATIAGLEKELSQYKPRVDQNVILGMLSTSSRQHQLSMTYVDRYLGMGVISELSWLTPTNIRLIDLRVRAGAGQAGKLPVAEVKKETSPLKEGTKGVVIEGIVFGDRKVLEATLAGYVMKLKSSPMFSHVSVQKNSIELLRRNEVLHFVVEMKLV